MGGGLSSLESQNLAVASRQTVANTKTSSQLSKTHDGVVSVPQPLSKSAGRLFSKKILWRVGVASLLVILIVALVVAGAQYKNSRVAKYKYNVCSESNIDKAVGYYESEDKDRLSELSTRLSRDGDYIYDAKCLYIKTISANAIGSKLSATYYLKQFDGSADSSQLSKYLSAKGYELVAGLKTKINKMPDDVMNNNSNSVGELYKNASRQR